MIDDRCREVVSVGLVKVEERGKKATFKNPGKQQFVRIKMDGCVVQQATAADWVVMKHDVGTVIVELKGKHVEHGAKQVDTTATYLRSNNLIVGKIAGLIVSSEYPKASTAVQKAQANFFKKHRGPLHVVTHNAEYTFEKVLVASGPF